MPKLSATHEEGQRQRILAAALQCMIRHGIHTMSMDQIIAEAGMSSSTVYRYFPNGRTSIVRTIIEGWFASIGDHLEGTDFSLHEAGAPSQGNLEDILTTALEAAWNLKVELAGTQADVARVTMDLWSACSRNDDLRELCQAHFVRIHGYIAAAVTQLQNAGLIGDHISPKDAAKLLHLTMLGLTTQRSLSASANPRTIATLLAPLLAPAS
ncbi:MAG: TetR/AcrR family transcriptional regulator [Actinomycetaceae bacterium]|nr:TetR/AcrR family transcriptional regulator [Actinomycetaceae bacterium]